MTGRYLQYGCGWCTPEGWLNFDASPTLRFERLPVLGWLYTKNATRFPANVRYGDIVKGLPVKSGSCAAIYCSHVLEHLALDDLDKALRHTQQYLAPGGTFRFVLPDLEALARAYLSDPDGMASCRFMEAACLGKRSRSHGLRAVVKEWLGKSAHLWMWDEKSMRAKLEEHGFHQIRQATFGDAEDRRFCEVEDPGRFAGCLAMQCLK